MTMDRSLMDRDPDRWRSELVAFSEALDRGDASVCGAAPRWLIAHVKEVLDGFIREGRLDDSAAVQDFARGGIRFVADAGGPEVEKLLAALGRLL